MRYSGSDWIKKCVCPEPSELGAEVADLLGDMFQGIYHLDPRALRRVDWQNRSYIEINIGWRSMATVDDNLLTILVVLSHDRMIRVSVSAATHKYLNLLFHKRKRRHGTYDERMPALEDHIDLIRKHYYAEGGE